MTNKLLRLGPASAGARALARFDVQTGATLKCSPPLAVGSLKRRERHAPSLILLAVLSIALLAGCAKSVGDKPADVPEKTDPKIQAGVTMDAATQQRIGLEITNLVATQWQPEMKGYGRVIDPATLSAAVTDLESARATAEMSARESDRQKFLAEQNNVSVRALEAAKMMAMRDQLGFGSTRAKFALDWGKALADHTNLLAFIQQLAQGEAALVRIDLPPGETLPSPPASAKIVALTDETKLVNGDFLDATAGLNPQTQSQSFFFLVKGQSLPPGAAVTGFLKISGEPANGVIVPSSAVLRYEGKGWIYMQTETNQFVRTEIPLDRLMDNGWFVSQNLSATNRIVISGAQTILSAEMSGGNFNTGARD